jgi:hypothetical protein
MPRYYFNVYDGSEPPYVDEVGDELPDDAAAWRSALISAGQSIRDMNRRFSPVGTWRMDVLDATGDILFSLHFRGEAQKRPGPSSVS